MSDTLSETLDLSDGPFMSLLQSFLQTWNEDPRGVWIAFSMIIFSEIGDKTFLIAAILSMRQPRVIVFLGAFGALVVMSILSSLLGVMFPTLLPKWLTTLCAALLFFVFGVKMFKDGLQMTGEEMGEEWEEAKREVEEETEAIEDDRYADAERGQSAQMEMGALKTDTQATTNGHAPNGQHDAAVPYPPSDSDLPTPLRSATLTSSTKMKEGARNLCSLCFSPVFAQAFGLTFLGEWGDRSQIATIALAAAHNIVLVAFGTIVGHSLCTGLAVLAGSYVAKRISIKHVTLGGAILFILFGFIYLYESVTGGEIDVASISAAPIKDAIPSLKALDNPASKPGIAAVLPNR